MKLEWTLPAVNSLQGIHDYIARDQAFYATRFIERIIAAAERLQEFPQLGRKVPESDDPKIREILFQTYRIIYRITSERIQILTVVHGSRDLTRITPKPWEIG